MNSITPYPLGSQTVSNRISVRQLTLVQPQPVTRVLVTANRLQLAALLQKGLHLQGWTSSVATTVTAVLDTLKHDRVDLVLLDADFFQIDTFALIRAIDQRRSPVVVLAEDYEIDTYDLRDVIAADNIFIKPFSTYHLMSFLQQRYEGT